VDAVATRVHTLSSLKEIAKKTGDAAQLSYPFGTTAGDVPRNVERMR